MGPHEMDTERAKNMRRQHKLDILVIDHINE